MCYSAWCSNTYCKHEMTINSSLLAGYWATQKPKANMGEDQWLGRNEAGLWRCLLPGLVQPFLKPELREPSACWSSSCVWNNDPRRNWAVSGSRCCHPNVAWISKASFSSRRRWFLRNNYLCWRFKGCLLTYFLVHWKIQEYWSGTDTTALAEAMQISRESFISDGVHNLLSDLCQLLYWSFLTWHLRTVYNCQIDWLQFPEMCHPRESG